jgi:hypothetical protein
VWILIVGIISVGSQNMTSMTTASFQTEEACEFAGKLFEAKVAGSWREPFHTCNFVGKVE